MTVDLLASKHFKDAPRTSARSHFPRVCFSGGITSFSYMPAHEWPGVLLTLTLLGTMNRTSHAVLGVDKPTDIQEADRLICLELLLCFHAWICYGPFTELYEDASYALLDKCARDLATLLVRTCNREEGKGYKLQKFHDLFVHLISDIRDTGSGYALHMGLIERMHKFFAKIPACTSQKRGGYKFLSQVAARLHEQQMLTQARQMYQCSDNLRNDGKRRKNKTPLPGPAARVVIKESITQPSFAYTWLGSSPPKNGLHPLIYNSVRKVLLHDENSNLVENFLLKQLDGTLAVNIYTEANIGGRIFRCHPDYQKEGPWYDWVMVSWEYDQNDVSYMNTKQAAQFYDPILHSEFAKRRSSKIQPPNEIVSDLSSHSAEPAPIASEANGRVMFVPARILCFLKDINNGRPWVVVHPCHSLTTTHSLLT